MANAPSHLIWSASIKSLKSNCQLITVDEWNLDVRVFTRLSKGYKEMSNHLFRRSYAEHALHIALRSLTICTLSKDKVLSCKLKYQPGMSAVSDR